MLFISSYSLLKFYNEYNEVSLYYKSNPTYVHIGDTIQLSDTINNYKSLRISYMYTDTGIEYQREYLINAFLFTKGRLTLDTVAEGVWCYITTDTSNNKLVVSDVGTSGGPCIGKVYGRKK